jgi:hypothetical protein
MITRRSRSKYSPALHFEEDAARMLRYYWILLYENPTADTTSTSTCGFSTQKR